MQMHKGYIFFIYLKLKQKQIYKSSDFERSLDEDPLGDHWLYVRLNSEQYFRSSESGQISRIHIWQGSTYIY